MEMVLDEEVPPETKRMRFLREVTFDSAVVFVNIIGYASKKENAVKKRRDS